MNIESKGVDEISQMEGGIKKTKGIFWSGDICEKICYIENHPRKSSYNQPDGMIFLCFIQYSFSNFSMSQHHLPGSVFKI